MVGEVVTQSYCHIVVSAVVVYVEDAAVAEVPFEVDSQDVATWDIQSGIHIYANYVYLGSSLDGQTKVLELLLSCTLMDLQCLEYSQYFTWIFMCSVSRF